MRRTQVATAGFKSGPGSPVALSYDQTFAVEFVASKAQILHRHVFEHSLRPICTSSRAACDQWAIDAMAPGKPTVRANYGEANSPTPCDMCLSLACTCPPSQRPIGKPLTQNLLQYRPERRPSLDFSTKTCRGRSEYWSPETGPCDKIGVSGGSASRLTGR